MTLVVELAIIARLCPRTSRTTTLLVALAANLVTHPLATIALTWFDADFSFWQVEGLVLATEALLFHYVAGLPLRGALQLSALANGATVLIALSL